MSTWYYISNAKIPVGMKFPCEMSEGAEVAIQDEGGFLERLQASSTLPWHSLKALGILGAKAQAAVPAVVEAVKDPDETVRYEAIETLEQVCADKAALTSILLDAGGSRPGKGRRA